MKNKIYFIFLVNILAICNLNQVVFAGSSRFYKEINLIGGYSDRYKWIGKNSDLMNSVGFEDYRKFSGEYGDYLTTDLQMRVAYDSVENSQDAWGLQIHNAWFYHRLADGINLRVGHFDPAFGLEPQLDTHGTILQTLAEKDIGFKKDWGFGLEGSLPKFDYKVALQLGSGMSIYRRDDSFLLTSRVGAPTDKNLQYGVSFLYGRVLESMGMFTFPRAKLDSDKAVFKKRAGLDGQYLLGPYLFKTEISYGENGRNQVLGYLTELDYTIPKYQNLEIELQFQSWINNIKEKSSDDSTLTLGLSYRLNQSTTLRAAFSHDTNLMSEKEDNKIIMQFYFFGA